MCFSVSIPEIMVVLCVGFFLFVIPCMVAAMVYRDRFSKPDE